MNINVSRMRPTVRRLDRIERQLARIGDALETWLIEQGIPLKRTPLVHSDDELAVSYVDEEEDAVREYLDRMRKEHGYAPKESAEAAD